MWIKEVWGRILHMQSTQRAAQVLLFIYNTLMRLLHWSTISSSLTLDRWHQRKERKRRSDPVIKGPEHSLSQSPCTIHKSQGFQGCYWRVWTSKSWTTALQTRTESVCIEYPSQSILQLQEGWIVRRAWKLLPAVKIGWWQNLKKCHLKPILNLSFILIFVIIMSVCK